MTDIFSKTKRSVVMRAVKGRGNKSTEVVFKRILCKNKISGWRTNQRNLPGRPDFVFRIEKVAVFVDGCFWHGCPKCSRNLKPGSNQAFWRAKMVYNKSHDQKVSRALLKSGWKVLRFWEHEVQKKPDWCVLKLRKALNG